MARLGVLHFANSSFVAVKVQALPVEDCTIDRFQTEEWRRGSIRE